MHFASLPLQSPGRCAGRIHPTSPQPRRRLARHKTEGAVPDAGVISLVTSLALLKLFSSSFTLALRISFSRFTASSSALCIAASSYLMAAAAAFALGLRGKPPPSPTALGALLDTLLR